MIKYNLFILRLAVTLLILVSCQKEFKPLISEDLLAISINTDSNYFADGFSRIPIIVRLKTLEVDHTNKLIEISASEGTIEPNELFLDGDGLDTVYFKPGYNPGTIKITAKVKSKPSISVSSNLRLIGTDASEIIKISFDNDTNIANGVTAIDGMIQVKNAPNKSVKLTLDGDLNFSPDNKNEITRSLNSSGQVNFTIQPDLNVGEYLITAELIDERNHYVGKKLKLFPVNTEDVLAVTLNNSTNIIADGEQIISGTIKISNYLIGPVEVAISNGSFLSTGKSDPIELMPNASNGESTVLIKTSTLPGTYLITTTLKSSDLSVKKTLNVGPAFPDSLLITSSAYYVDSVSGGNLNLTVHLIRSSGKTSEDLPLIVTATQNGNNVGNISYPIKSNSSQQASFSLSIIPNSVVKNTPIIISVAVDSGLGGMVSENLEISVQ